MVCDDTIIYKMDENNSDTAVGESIPDTIQRKPEPINKRSVLIRCPAPQKPMPNLGRTAFISFQ